MHLSGRFLLAFLAVLCNLECRCNAQFHFPGQHFMDYSGPDPGLQVNGEGRAFVTAGNQLFKLSGDLVLEQNVSLASPAVRISISPEGESLMVCTTDLSCVVYNTGDLSVQPINAGIHLLSADSAALFSTEGSFYVGSYVSYVTGGVRGHMRLSQYIYEVGTRSVIRTTDYDVGRPLFTRNFVSGFVSDDFVYFIVRDATDEFRNLRVMRVCHATSCPGNSDTCGFTALYEEGMKCGDMPTSLGDGVCGVSVVEEFGGTSGTSMILSKCRQGSTSSNIVCSFNLSAVDNTMDMRYDGCKARTIWETEVAWVGVATPCDNVTFTSTCNFSKPLSNVNLDELPGMREIHGTDIIDVGSDNGDIAVSLALIVDGVSLVVAGYSRDNRTSHSVGFFEVTGKKDNLDNVFDEKNFSSSILSLQWQSGLDYIMAATQHQVVRIPLEECSSSKNCSSCVGSSNPLCGWCVVEDKCSRVSNCRDGNSTSSIRWIHTIPTESSSNLCIVKSVTPNQFLLDNQEVLSVKISGTGLPDLLPAENYSCHLADSEGRFNITVPAVAINTGYEYTCNITDRVPFYSGITAVINFSFVSSRTNIPFATTSSAMTIYRCSATSKCSDCLETANACGWCVVNKRCRGTAADCTSSTNFLQLSGRQIFQDVCPLLDLKDGNSNYTLTVRIATALQLTTRNLPPMVSGFSYMCLIGRKPVKATRIDDTIITCQVNSNQLKITGATEVAELGITWSNSADINHLIDSLNFISVTLYDCRVKAMDCNSCVSTRDKSDFMCGWCLSTSSQCSIYEECSTSPILTDVKQCPIQNVISIFPNSGPTEGGTIITIIGIDLGISLTDFNSPSGILINNIACIPLNRDYISGRQVLCETGATAAGSYPVIVQHSAISLPYKFVEATVINVEPTFGPIAGGSVLTISGTNLNIGNSATVRVKGISGPECSDVSRSATRITCTTPGITSTPGYPGDVVVQIDNQIISDPAVQFSYRNNPRYTSIKPQFTIRSGGINITFNGTDLDVASNPQLIFNNDFFSSQSPCTVVSSSTLTCTAPLVSKRTDRVMYELKLDNAPPPSLTEPSLKLSVKEDPKLAGVFYDFKKELLIIDVHNFDSVLKNEVIVTIEGQSCTINLITASKISCKPFDLTVFESQESQEFVFGIVTIGQNLEYKITDFNGYFGERNRFYFETIFGPAIIVISLLYCVGITVVYIFTICMMEKCWRRRKLRAAANVTELKHFNDNFLARNIPAYLLDGLMEKLPAHLIISSNELRMIDVPLGQGQFGIVYKAHLVRHDAEGLLQSSAVAVKILKGALSYSDIENVFSEILKMQDFSHSNVMALVGVCIDGASGPSIIMKYMKNGSLLNYLKRERSHLFLDYDSDEKSIISVRKLLLKICHQISLGMAYLSCNQIVHRDLAARNCLLDSEGNIKVSDFGLSEDVYNTGYFRQNKNDAVRLPFKWMAPESFRDAIFTGKSDVWSFGVTCWEVFSAGRVPYPGVHAIDLPKLLDEGVRLDYPTNAANASEIYIIINRCWKQSPEDRPSFQELSFLWESRLQAMSGHMEMDMVLESQEELSANTGEADTCEVLVVSNFPRQRGLDLECNVMPDVTRFSTSIEIHPNNMENEIMESST